MAVQKNTCKYIMKKGAKAGKPCGKGCRGKFCNDHNNNKQQYHKKYNDKINSAMREETIKKKALTKCKKFSRIDLNKQLLLLNKIYNKILYINRMVLGCEIAENPDYKLPVNSRYLEYIKSGEFDNLCRREYNNYLNNFESSKMNYEEYHRLRRNTDISDDEARKETRRWWKYNQMRIPDTYDDFKKKENDIILNDPNNHIVPIKYDGTINELARYKNKLNRKKQLHIKKYKIQKEIVNEIKKME